MAILFNEEAETLLKNPIPSEGRIYYAIIAPFREGDKLRDKIPSTNKVLLSTLLSGALTIRLARYYFAVEKRPVIIEIGYDGA